jgi:hypothetical protein
MKTFEIYNNGLMFWTRIFITTDHEKAYKAVSRNLKGHFEGEETKARALTFYIEEYSQACIWFNAKPSSKICVGIISHEAFHVICHMFRLKGIPISRETEEVFAYNLESLVSEITTKLKKGRK